jgi:penicillin-binding protein 2
VFKPFVAAYALDRIHFDPASEFSCEPAQPGGTGFYADLHCAGTHHLGNLQRALEVSCNVYFAHVGECFTNDELADMTRMFGFGEPTGVRMFGTQGRSGLVEHWRLKWNKTVLAALDGMSGKRRFANGLTYVEATPMQVARAMAGIATGRLPEVSLVHSIGGQRVAPRGRELGIGDTSLAFVRRAMELVVSAPAGSAYDKGLDAKSLGFQLAAKTGSGDYAQFERGDEASASDRADAEENRVRKHTWVAGFFPADKPRAVVVVYLHDTSRTSSHTAVYVTAQFLQTEAVKHWLARTLEAEQKRAEQSLMEDTR